MFPFPIHLRLTLDTVHSRLQCSVASGGRGEVVNKGRMAVATVQLKLQPFCTCDNVTRMFKGVGLQLCCYSCRFWSPPLSYASTRDASLHVSFAPLYSIPNSPIPKVVSTLEKGKKELEVRGGTEIKRARWVSTIRGNQGQNMNPPFWEWINRVVQKGSTTGVWGLDLTLARDTLGEALSSTSHPPFSKCMVFQHTSNLSLTWT